MDRFKLQAPFKMTGDQPQAVDKLVNGLKDNLKYQTLLGVTGSGKTFTMANVIERVQRPTLVISHNKTLSAQLTSEFRQFFPKNEVHWFVSYYDYYQPEAYIPRTDTYIEKEATINEEIERRRYAATASLLSRRDVIICASVSCIYGLGKPGDWQIMSCKLERGADFNQGMLISKLIGAQYERNDIDFSRGKFRVRGEVIDIFPSYGESFIRIEFTKTPSFKDKIRRISEHNFLTSEEIREFDEVIIYPAKHWVTPPERLSQVTKGIREELEQRWKYFKKQGKELEAQRLNQRVNFDLEMLEQVGYCSGIENYSRYLDGRRPGQPPFTLIDYFPDDFLMFIDESHMTVPQIDGMYKGDRSRKETLVEYGFRLPSCLDNRPLKFSEFEERINQVIFTSATPGPYELTQSSQGQIKSIRDLGKEVSGITQQLIRPTGLLDPQVERRRTKGQIDDLISEIRQRVQRGERVLVTTLTKRMAESLAEYLADLKIKVQYIHSEVETLKRLDILRDLRQGKYDVLVGINLLREGLDLPEVSLVAILDADKEGYLRSESALIQVMGRAARHVNGKAIMYADKLTKSMKAAIAETSRRRKIQEEFNKKHNITPQSITKEIRDILFERETQEAREKLKSIDIGKIKDRELADLIGELENQMEIAASNLEFERAAMLRDEIGNLKEEFQRRKMIK